MRRLMKNNNRLPFYCRGIPVAEFLWCNASKIPICVKYVANARKKQREQIESTSNKYDTRHYSIRTCEYRALRLTPIPIACVQSKLPAVSSL